MLWNVVHSFGLGCFEDVRLLDCCSDLSEALDAFIIRATLMVEVGITSETSVNVYHTTRRSNPEDVFILGAFRNRNYRGGFICKTQAMR